jgi:outer membrane protein OmpA-like peptidoglycan-associated protein
VEGSVVTTEQSRIPNNRRHSSLGLWPALLSLALLGSLEVTACEDRVRELEEKMRRGTSPALMAQARQVVRECPKSARAHNALATVLEESGDLAGAASEYETARELSPGWAYPLLGLGDLALSRNDVDSARKYYLEAARVATTEEESTKARRALQELPQGGSYQFKTSRSLREMLKVGTDHRGARAVGVRYPPLSAESYASSSEIAVNLSVPFAFDSAALQPDALPQLSELALALRQAGTGERYVIEGHTSSEGTPERNRKLSQLRAESVVRYLIDSGVNSTILEPRGFGPQRLVMENGTENREKSRRVTVSRPF